MLSDKIRRYADEKWDEIKPGLNKAGTEADRKINELSGDEKTLLKLAYATLPASDAAAVDFDILKSYAQQALELRESSPYCRDIPEDIFLHCVYYPRINSEEIVDCRPFFRSMLGPLTEGKNGTEAVLAINRWCGENMCYQSTDDRSINPLTAYSCAVGRCGEESVFAVTALRSVGIPARQIYVPWWSHCDDNHAWVECYVDGGWHFFGACEPEPELDRGWFLNASGRAMTVCSRNFFPYTEEGLKGEKLIFNDGICLAYNQIKRYADTADTTVYVRDEKGRPIPGAMLRFYVENMARLSCIAALETGEEGKVCLVTGMGSMLAEAEYRGLFAWKYLDIKENTEEVLVPNRKEPEIGDEIWGFRAPEGRENRRGRLSEAQLAEKKDTLNKADEKRRSRIESYWREKYEAADEKMQKILHTAAGHSEELWSFYEKYGHDGETMLLSLSEKDMRDADTRVLAAHIEKSEKFRGREGFDKYIRCPRIGLEQLSDWRAAADSLTEEEQEDFLSDPHSLWNKLEREYTEGSCRWHKVLWLQPCAALSLKAADIKGRRLLFTAIMRSLGMAARLDPVDGRAQYLEKGVFKTVENEDKPGAEARLVIKKKDTLRYNESWGLSRWSGGWESLEIDEGEAEKLLLPCGIYRLHTVNRLPGGGQLVGFKTFRLEKDMELEVKKREAGAEQMLSDFKVQPPVRPEGIELQIYLSPGEEPSEHCLNELVSAAERINGDIKKGLRVRLIIPDTAAAGKPAYKKTVSAIAELKTDILKPDDSRLEALARDLYLEPGLRPLICLTDGTSSRFAHAGYAAGSVALALQCAEIII